MRSTIQRFGRTTKPLAASDRLTICSGAPAAWRTAGRVGTLIGAVGDDALQKREQRTPVAPRRYLRRPPIDQLTSSSRFDVSASCLMIAA